MTDQVPILVHTHVPAPAHTSDPEAAPLPPTWIPLGEATRRAVLRVTDPELAELEAAARALDDPDAYPIQGGTSR